MVSMGQSDRATIEAILAGQTDAYAELVVRHSRRLFRLAFRIAGDEADADDIVQEAFLRAYVKLDSFGLRSDFGTWIYRIAVHCALDKLKSRTAVRVRQVAEEDDPGQYEVQVADSAPDPERLAISREIGALEEKAMSGLTSLERAAFVLRHMEDQTTQEIAAALDMAPNNAKQTVYRAVQKVRQRLEALKVTV